MNDWLLKLKNILLENIKLKNKLEDKNLLFDAFDFSAKYHSHQKRKSGEPYFIHPFEVANKLLLMDFDTTTVVVGFLHDCIEDTEATKDLIENTFSKEVADIVDGITKLDKIKFSQKQIHQVENFRKLFLALSKDIRVLIVKLIDRLHNMETVQFHTSERQKEIAIETLEIFAPLAERIGLQTVKNDLQAICFKILHPKECDEIEQKIQNIKQDLRSKNIIDEIKVTLENLLSQNTEIEFHIFGREKTAYSIWKKIKNLNIKIEDLSDIIGFRIITDTIDNCYKILGAIHQKYHAVPGKLIDYISTPKINNYQSIHTSIMAIHGHKIEIQIRTKKMHEEAEFGLSAHWRYKENLTNAKYVDRLKFSWINRVIQILENVKNPHEIMKAAKLEIDEDYISVFSENGEIITMPYRSTILDFSVLIDEKLAEYFDYAIVNDQVEGINYTLKEGDQIKIFTSVDRSVQKTWINHCITSKARNWILSKDIASN